MITCNQDSSGLSSVCQFQNNVEILFEKLQVDFGYEAARDLRKSYTLKSKILSLDSQASRSSETVDELHIQVSNSWDSSAFSETVDRERVRYEKGPVYYVRSTLYKMERRRKGGSGSRGYAGSGSSYGGGFGGEGSSRSYGMAADHSSEANRDRDRSHDRDMENKGMGTAVFQFSEDMRISKILRRLCAETNGKAAIDLCGKLQQGIHDPANATYIRRAFDFLAELLVSVLSQGPVECLSHVAVVFGMLGYVIRNDFNIYRNWIFRSYDSNKNIREHLMEALKYTLECDSMTLDILSNSERLITSLKDRLECADRVEDFIAVSDVISEFAKNYQDSFDKYFTDVVDIVVGWHLETEQSMELKQHCSIVLQCFTDFFMRKEQFTFGLISQFLEDIATFGDEMENPSNDGAAEKSTPPEVSFGSFVGAFNSVLKCLGYAGEKMVFHISPTLFEEAIKTIMRVSCLSLRLTSCQETVYSVNEFLTMILSCERDNVPCDYTLIYQIAQLQMSALDSLNETQVESFLFMLVALVKDLNSNTPLDFIAFVVDPDNENMMKLKLTSFGKHYEPLIELYDQILSVKSVPVLQEAYRHILLDMRRAMKCIKERDLSKYTTEQAEGLLLFYLAAIVNIATQTSSIIGMYALQPTILELLINDLEMANINVWAESQVVHNGCVNLLIAHCMKNSNYVLTSNLVISNVFTKLFLEDVSSTSRNFLMILKFLADIICAPQLSHKTTFELLDWIRSIYQQCSQYASDMKNDPSFVQVSKNICKLSTGSHMKIALECAKCIDILVQFKDVNPESLAAIGEACCIHMCSTSQPLRYEYSLIFAKVPLNAALKEAQETHGLVKSKDVANNELQRWYTSSPISANIQEINFRKFFEMVALKDCATTMDDFLLEIFPKWTSQKGRSADFFKLAQNNLNYLQAWIEWEITDFCVNNKLRTPFGKPQETLVKIESLIREGAQAVSQQGVMPMKDINALVANQKHLRVLLRIVECLEKGVYNAAEGTAFAMSSPEKPARSFFRVNTPTCYEWFSRIRTAVDLIAMHSFENEMIIRCSEAMLKVLVSSEKTSDPTFENTLLLYVWALIRNSESDTLHGLYIWAKKVSGKRFAWIKHATEHAAGHREKAAEGYSSMLTTKEDQNLDGNVRDFIGNQLMECLYLTGQWEELKDFIHTQKWANEQQFAVPSATLKYDQVESLEFFEQSGDAAVISLANWDVFESSQNFASNCSVSKTLAMSENTIRSILIENSNQFDESKWNIAANVVQSGIEEFLLSKPKDNLNHFILLNHLAYKSKMLRMNPDSIENYSLRSLVIDKVFGSAIMIRTLRWAEYMQSVLGIDFYEVNDLRLKAASLARKEGNTKLSKHILEKFFDKVNEELVHEGLCAIDTKLRSICIESVPWNEDTIRGTYEASKWLYSQSGKQEEAIHFQAKCCLGSMLTGKASESLSRSLLTLADWVGQSSENVLAEMEGINLKNLLDEILPMQSYSDDSTKSIIPNLDKAVGKLIYCSTEQWPKLAKAWSALGTWCYRWGRKIFEHRTSDGLRPSDVETIKDLVPNATAEDIDKIVSILCQSEILGDDEEIGPNEVSSTEIIECQLRNIPILADIDLRKMQAIVKIWRQAHKSVYGYYELAASAYFKYLTLAPAAEDEKKNGDCSTVTATLRLLRLIVKHALGLQEVLEEGLSTTPTHPWKVITPQLFSRLNHHELYVRKRVSELLCRVAKDSPHLIIFPAVVGAAQERSSGGDSKTPSNNALIDCFHSLLSTLSKQSPETVSQVQVLVRELKRITLLWDEYWLYSVAQLYSEYSELFRTIEADVRKCPEDKLKLVTEKHRVLMEHVVADMNRLAQVSSRHPETNYERNFQDKYGKIISATIDDLKKPFDASKPAELSHKIKQLYLMFQQRVQRSSQSSLKIADISPVLANLKNTAISMPGVEASEKNQIYIKSMDHIVHILPTKTKPKKMAFFGSDGKRYTYLFKGLEDLHLDERIMQFLSIANTMISKSVEYNGFSPNYRAHHYSVIPLGPRSGLISWVDGAIPIFGLYKKWQQREAASPKKDKQFTVLRPSELFYNKLTPLLAENNVKTVNNRKSWPLAVLRQVLDELTKETPHDLLAKEIWCYSNNAACWRRSVRTYSVSVAVMSVIGYVIGLGDRHLDNILVKLSTGEIVHIDYNVCFEKGKTLRVPEKVPFRMTPNMECALGVTGIEGTFRLACEHVLKTLRKERETLLTLLEAFVYDPLVDWAVNDDGTTSNSRVTTVLAAAADIVALTAYANSAAAAREIKRRGSETEAEVEIPHDTSESGIGTKDSTPDQCPTSSIATASTTGTGTSNDVTGTPTASTSSSDKKHTRKKLFENEVMRDTLTSRFAEIKPEWTQYRNEVNEQLRRMMDYLDDLKMQRKQMMIDEQKRDLLTKQIAMVREIETLGTAMSSHSINTLSQRYNVYRKAADEFNQIKQTLISMSRGYSRNMDEYLTALYHSDDNKIKDLKIALENLCQLELPNEFEHVKDFLRTSAQEAMYMQADQCRKELDASFLQQSYIIKMGLDALQQYHHIASHMPKSEHDKHRFTRYREWTSMLAYEPERSEDVLKTMNQMIEQENNPARAEQVLAYAYKLETLWMEENFALRENLDALQSPLSDPNDLVIDAKNSIVTFRQTELTSNTTLQCVLLTFLLDTRNQFHALEVGAQQGASDPFFILSEQLSYLKVIIETPGALFFAYDAEDPHSRYIDQMSLIATAIQSLKDIEILLRTKEIPKIFQHVMGNQTQLARSLLELRRLQPAIDAILTKPNKMPISDSDFTKVIEAVDDIVNYADTECCYFFGRIDQMFSAATKKFEECYRELSDVLQISRYKHVMDTFVQNIPLNLFENYTVTSLRRRFELHKLQVLIQIVQEAEHLSNSLINSDVDAPFDHKLLMQPVGAFIYEMECSFLFGLGPYMISLLTNELLIHTSANVLSFNAVTLDMAVPALIEEFLMLSLFTSTQYTYAQSLCLKLCMVMKEQTQADYVNESISIHHDVIGYLQVVSTVHAWLNDRFLPDPPPFGHIIHKHIMLSNLHNAAQNLNAWKISIQKINDERISFTRAIEQRLKWAVGANPSLTGLQNHFTECLEKQELKFRGHSDIANTVLLYATAVGAYENLQNSRTEISEADEELMVIITDCDRKHKAHKQAAATITTIEEELVQLLDPEGTVDHCWISNVTGLLDDMTDAMQRKIASLEKDLVTTQDNLQMSAHKLRALMDNELRMDVRYLLKLILKVDKNNQASKHKQFQSNYKQFLSRVNDLHIKVLSKDFTEEIVLEIRDIIAGLIEELDDIYEDLLRLMSDRGDGEGQRHKDKKLSGTPIRESKKGNQPEQKRNAYAVSVWRRIRMKLEGRDPDPNRRLTVAEQVDWMIREAMNPDNLAVLYEGWTPWV